MAPITRMDAPPPFAEAAAALEAGTPPDAMPPALRALVAGFDLTHADAPLLRLAARIGAPFRLPAPDAPGLILLGAGIDLSAAAGEAPGSLPMASASGAGETPGAALRACLGEAAELLASVETGAHRAAMRAAAPPDPTLAALLDTLPWPHDARRTLWHPVRRMTDDATLWLPRELLFRTAPERRAFAPPWPLSLGCAAGPTRDAALLHALEELVERDAVALWWRGGLPARPIALENPAAARAAALLARLRGERAVRRRSWLLDITSDLGVPAVAALSVNAEGRGLCCGFAARATGLGPAAEAALRELAQMELGQALALRKEALRGPEALNRQDAAHAARAAADPAAWPLLHPGAPPAAIPPLAAEDAPAEAVLAALLERLAAHGLAPLRLDLDGTDAICLPVVRVLCPGLQSETGPGIGPRLRDAVARSGGGVAGAGALTLT